MFNLKINADQGKDDTSSNRTSNSKPRISSRDKDFRKILGDKEDGKEDEDKDSRHAKALESENPSGYEKVASTEEKPRQQQPSLFDLSKNKNVLKKTADEEASDVAQMASADEMPMESPSSIFKSLALKEKAQSKEKLERAGKSMSELNADEAKTPSRFPQESMDLSYVNPLAYNAVSQVEIGDQKLDKMLPSQKLTMQQLVDSLVKAITTAESQGKTDTVVTLKQPPMFAGANVVLTSFETAKGEFNIRFENLTQQAAAFMQQNQESLLANLQQKGYAVHIMVATTQVETPIVANPQQTREGNPDQQQQEQQGQGRRRQPEEEEA